MKHLSLVIALVLLVSFQSAHAAYRSRVKSNVTLAWGQQVPETAAEAAMEAAPPMSPEPSPAPPPRRGNGRDAMKSFMFGCIGFIPLLGTIFVPFAFLKGMKNRYRSRKGHGFAIAGMILATIGLALTILILTA